VISKQIISEGRFDLGIAYIKKNMVSMSHFPNVLSRLVAALTELVCSSPAKKDQLTSKHILELVH